MNPYHCCASCTHYEIRKHTPEKYWCSRLGYATSPKYVFDCWTPKESVLHAIGKNKPK
ncbi:hypothetical protein [Paenibacillus oceani]|uniref:Uncharacterized protein n=1 Tax=Paenibacillus oceani TaxID=2772510 RepID=A0A927GZK3_9BACL|nr:hypothetical protein [Paenibacillus oceani]MBD2863086.1 hypothetical protein [Paenibacillus oceani]